MKRRTLLHAGAAAAAATTVWPAQAQERTKIAYGYSAVSDFATAFVATDEGFFAKRGLDVEPKFIPLNPTIIPGVESGSLQMGGPTPTGYLQSIAGGPDQVVIGGGGMLSKTYTDLGIVARAGTGIAARKTASARRSACRASAPCST